MARANMSSARCISVPWSPALGCAGRLFPVFDSPTPTFSLPGSFREASQSRPFKLTHLGAHSNALTYPETGCPPQLLGVFSFLLRLCSCPWLCSLFQAQGPLLLGLCPAAGLGSWHRLPCPSRPCLVSWRAQAQIPVSLWPLLRSRCSASTVGKTPRLLLGYVFLTQSQGLGGSTWAQVSPAHLDGQLLEPLQGAWF